MTSGMTPGTAQGTRQPGVERYADIIDLPHHTSAKHPPMSAEQRAAQFAPFAALTGFGDMVADTAADAIDEVNSADYDSSGTG